MIKINSKLTTPDGGTIIEGSVIDVTPHFVSSVIDVFDVDGNVIGQRVKHDCMFDVNVYRNMIAYESKTPRIKTTFLEFNIGYVENDIDIVALNANVGSLDIMFGWLQSHIENGAEGYTGIGASNTTIVYPFVK